MVCFLLCFVFSASSGITRYSGHFIALPQNSLSLNIRFKNDLNEIYTEIILVEKHTNF